MKNLPFNNEFQDVIGAQAPPLDEPALLGTIIENCYQSGLGFHEALVMVLKAEFQKHTDLNKDMSSLKGNAPGPEKFLPESELYFQIFEDQGSSWASRSGYTRDMCNILIQEMVENKLYSFGVKSPEVIHFIERAVKEKELLLKEGSDALRSRHQQAKGEWLLLQSELGDRLLNLERNRLYNANINFRWMEIFGSAYVPLLEQEGRLEILRRKSLLLEMNPDILKSELDERLKEHTQEYELHVNRLRLEAAFAGKGQISPSDSLVMDYEHEKGYRQESKRILREIYLLIHPDILSQDKCFDQLTHRQRDSLQNIWNEVMALKEEEIGYGEGCLLNSFRSIPILMEKLDTIRAILQNAGIDIDPQLIIQGDTLSDQIAWIEDSIKSLKNAIHSLQAEQKVILEDDSVREREIMLKWPYYKQNELINEYQKQKNEVKREADELEENIEKHFKQRAQNGCITGSQEHGE